MNLLIIACNNIINRFLYQYYNINKGVGKGVRGSNPPIEN